MRNFNEIISKNLSDDKIKSEKKPRLYFLSRKDSSGKTTRWGQIDPQPF